MAILGNMAEETNTFLFEKAQIDAYFNFMDGFMNYNSSIQP